MMMRTPFQKALFLLLFCMLASLYAEAQRPRILRRVENRVRQKANREVDKAVDQVIDSLLTNEQQQRQEGEPQTEGDSARYQRNGISLSSGEFEPYQNPVLVNFSMDMTVTDRRGKEEQTTIHCTLDTWQTGMEVLDEETKMRVILDNEEGYMTTVTEHEDGKTQAIRMRQRKINVENIKPDESEFTVTRTGNTRTIDGYRCEEVIIEHEDGTTTAWVTDELDIDFYNVFSAMGRGQAGPAMSANTDIYGVGGIPIESTSVSKNGKETTFTRFYGFKTGEGIDRSVFNLDGIEVMDLGY